jgi:ABC-2 type transport system permease protein
MSHLGTIVKKEIRELLTPGSIISVFIMVMLFAALGGLIGDEVSKSTVMPVVGIANSDSQTIETEDGEWNAYEFLKNFYLKSGDKRITPENIDQFVIKMDKDDILQQMETSGASVALVLSDDFKKNIEDSLKNEGADRTYLKGEVAQYYVYQPSGMIGGTVSSTVTNALVSYMNSDLSKFITGEEESKYIDFLKYPIESSETYTFVNGEAQSDVTPAEISEALTGQTMFIPMIIMIIIMMVGSIVISSMGSEKENKTLETLLTLPISRTVIVTGKIIAAALVGLIFGLAYMFGMAFYISSITIMAVGDSGLDLGTIGLALGLGDYALIAVSMFLSIACALGICMILGAFAKNYKSAQTMTMPLSILAIIPMFITMFSGWYGSNALIQGVLFAIPFSHPMMATEALLNGDLTLVLAGIAYMAVFAVVSIFVTVRLYSSDILVTGLSQNKYIERIRGTGRKPKKSN